MSIWIGYFGEKILGIILQKWKDGNGKHTFNRLAMGGGGVQLQKSWDETQYS